MGKRKLTSFHPIYYILLLALISPIYMLLNQSTAGAVDVTIGLDEYIPFMKEWIIPYLLWYPFIYGALIYYCFAERKQYYLALSTIIIGKLLCFIVYFFWQTTVPRPDVVESGLLADLVRFLYSTDQPVNCLPSIHVLTTFVIMIVAYKRREGHFKEYASLTAIGTLIILSTLFTKQHGILDAVSGILVACAVYAAMQLVASKVHLFRFEPFKARNVQKVKSGEK
ncbi:MAG: phosphatase PAP2 family protein [Bacillus sp. (in: firmicutes)]